MYINSLFISVADYRNLQLIFVCLFVCLFLRQGLTLLPILECSDVISGHCKLPGSSDSLASTSQVAGTTGAYQHAKLIFLFFVETGFCHVAQDGLELLGSSDLSTSASQSVEITSVSHHAQSKSYSETLKYHSNGRPCL